MTGLPTPDGKHLDLVCDQCGQSLTRIGSSLRDWDVVWALVRRHGWTGSPLAIGNHWCPRCSDPHAFVSGGEPTVVDMLPLPEQPWRASVQAVGDAVIVELHGDLDVAVIDEFRALLAQVGVDYRHVVLDLADVRLIDSTVLGVLVRTRQFVAARRGTMCLVAASRFVVSLLHTMRLQGVFPILDDRDEVLRWLATEQD